MTHTESITAQKCLLLFLITLDMPVCRGRWGKLCLVRITLVNDMVVNQGVAHFKAGTRFIPFSRSSPNAWNPREKLLKGLYLNRGIWSAPQWYVWDCTAVMSMNDCMCVKIWRCRVWYGVLTWGGCFLCAWLRVVREVFFTTRLVDVRDRPWWCEHTHFPLGPQNISFLFSLHSPSCCGFISQWRFYEDKCCGSRR